jgi:16S rRNA (cytosine1407-C5)-methyltransferase
MSHKKNKQHLKPQKKAGKVIEDSLERFKRLMDVESFARMLEALKQPLLQAVRVNPLKGEVARSLDSWVDRYGWDTESIPYCDTGWWIKQSEVPVSQTIEHRLGFFYIQDAASMMPVELFDFQNTSRELILDMAASPGGKTTHLVSKTGDKSLVLANDSSQGRITALRLVLQSWGAAGTAVTAFPGERFGSWFPETFDKVLLDAPCSMQNLRTSEPIRRVPYQQRNRQHWLCARNGCW